jgi:hypothetical protein
MSGFLLFKTDLIVLSLILQKRLRIERLSIIRDRTVYKGFALLNGSRISLTKKRPPLQEVFIVLSLIFHSAFIQECKS